MVSSLIWFLKSSLSPLVVSLNADIGSAPQWMTLNEQALHKVNTLARGIVTVVRRTPMYEECIGDLRWFATGSEAMVMSSHQKD